MKSMRNLLVLSISLVAFMLLTNTVYSQDEDSSRQILKQGLIGAGTGAIAAGASGGKAGQGALIGAGTGIIGSMLLDSLTTPSYQRSSPPPPQQGYYSPGPGEEYYEEPPQESGTQKVLKQGLVGAGTGAIAAGASGGNAGTGALIGAGTGIIGNALLDTVTQPSQPRRVYRRVPPPQTPQNVQVQEEPTGPDQGRKRVIKKYDANGKLVSEEEIYY